MTALPEEWEAAFGTELRRSLDRLRLISLAALAEQRPGGSRADAARAAAQELADLAADAEGGPRRRLPALADHVVADALAVCAADVRAALGPARASEPGLSGLAALRLLRTRL